MTAIINMPAMPQAGHPVDVLDQFQQVPVGTRFNHAGVEWTKTGPDQWENDEPDGGFTYPSSNFTMGCCPEMVYTFVPEHPPIGTVTTSTNDAVLLPVGAQLILDGQAWPSPGTTVFEKIDNSERPWARLEDGEPDGTGQRYANAAFTSGWRVVGYRGLEFPNPDSPEPTVSYTQARLDEAVEQARIEAANRAQLTERRRWEADADRFGDAMAEYANREDLDSDFEDLAREWPQFLKPRTSEYDVEYTITVRHRRTVTARDEDAAREQANSDTGFYDGQDTTLYAESVTITDIDIDVEEV